MDMFLTSFPLDKCPDSSSRCCSLFLALALLAFPVHGAYLSVYFFAAKIPIFVSNIAAHFSQFCRAFFLNTAAQFTECRRVECWSNWFYQGLVDFYFCKEKIGLGRGQSPFRIQEYTYRKCRFIP